MGAVCQQNWTQQDEDGLALDTLSGVLHPGLQGQWEAKTSGWSFVCRHCRCQIEAGDRYYWHSTGWLAYHPRCVQGAMEKRGG